MDIQEIADYSRKIKHPANKHQAFKAVLEIIENKHTQADIARLYAYFLPKTGKAPKTALDWVGLAAAKKDVRHYLNGVVFCSSGLMYSTDGHRMHYAPTDKANGFYDLQGNEHLTATKEGWRFPEVDRVIALAKENNIKLKIDDFKPGYASNCHVYQHNDLAFQKVYFEQAIAGMDEPEILIKDKTAPIMIREDESGRVALIMPIRI